MKFDFIKRRSERFSVTIMCSTLGVSRPGFYAWMQRKPAARSFRHGKLLTRIQMVHAASKKRYGAKRVYQQLLREGTQFGRHQVAALMRANGLRGRYTRKFRVTTVTNSDHRMAANVLNRDFKPAALNRSWCADITCIWALEVWLYLAVVLDLYSRRVVGWATSKNIDEQLALDALDMAIVERKPPLKTVHHSDRGCHIQHAAKATSCEARLRAEYEQAW